MVFDPKTVVKNFVIRQTRCKRSDNDPPTGADVSNIAFFAEFWVIFGRKKWIFMVSERFWASKQLVSPFPNVLDRF